MKSWLIRASICLSGIVALAALFKCLGLGS